MQATYARLTTRSTPGDGFQPVEEPLQEKLH